MLFGVNGLLLVLLTEWGPACALTCHLTGVVVVLAESVVFVLLLTPDLKKKSGPSGPWP